MSDKMRWRYGDTNPVVAAVDPETVIEVGDLVWQHIDSAGHGNARPASAMPADAGAVNEPVGYNKQHIVDADPQRVFANKFLGVAMQRSRDGEANSVRVATTGTFEFDCPSGTFELGDLVGVRSEDLGDSPGKLLNQDVVKVTSSKHAIARVARRVPSADSTVLVDIRSTVMTGGIG